MGEEYTLSFWWMMHIRALSAKDGGKTAREWRLCSGGVVQVGARRVGPKADVSAQSGMGNPRLDLYCEIPVGDPRSPGSGKGGIELSCQKGKVGMVCISERSRLTHWIPRQTHRDSPSSQVCPCPQFIGWLSLSVARVWFCVWEATWRG